MGRSARALLLAPFLLATLLGPTANAAEPEAIGAPGLGPASGRPLLRRGTDQFIGGEAAQAAPIPGGAVSLNLVEVPVAVAAKAVLADTLGWGYTIDERVTGSLTLQTGGPVRRETLLALFETALASRGAVLRRRGGSAQILPAGAPGGLAPVRRLAEAAEAGPGSHAVPLRWISAAEMQAILAAVAPREVVLRADRARNLLILSGDAAQIQALRQTIAVFDVDWMRGMSTAILPVRSANPAAIARDLTQIFAAEATASGDIIRFVPNEPLSAILVVSARAAYLDRAREWVARLEDLAAERERQLFVYRIQNRSAKDLASVLQGVVAAETGAGMANQGYGGQGFGGQGFGLAGATYGAPGGGGYGWSGPGSAAVPLGGAPGLGNGLSPAGFGGTGGLSATPPSRGLDSLGAAGTGFGPSAGYGIDPPGALAGAGGYGGAGWAGSGSDPGIGAGGAGPRRDLIGIVADEANNSLVISATRNQYDKILKILGRLDAMPTQVLLETVIAEVTLNDSLEFGVQWFLANGGSRLNLAQAATVGAANAATGGAAGLITAAARGVTGFNYLLNNADFNVVLNALRGVTRVNVISSPNITVLDNRTAKLQIGDQVPIVKQTGQSALAGNAPILNQIEMKDTGVILSVTPRVNKSGLVVLDVNQEVSDVVPTTTSAINSPTIRQRRVATSVAVNDGHSLAIGGLVQEKAQIGTESVPVLGDLPLLGAAFRNRTDARVRTELIVFIRPKVIRGTADADRIASDFREQFRAMMPIRPVPAPPPLADLPPGSQGILRRMID